MRDRTNISDALENHEENKNKDLSSTICEFVSLECTPQVRYTVNRAKMLRTILCEKYLVKFFQPVKNSSSAVSTWPDILITGISNASVT